MSKRHRRPKVEVITVHRTLERHPQQAVAPTSRGIPPIYQADLVGAIIDN